MTTTHEKVFIAWGGNQPLAKAVGKAILKYQYQAVVGGGHVTDMYLGAQIISQIRSCTQAIILVQSPAVIDNGKLTFNDNMMYEWGYLTSRLAPDKVHVFLIDLLTRNLPSDVMGTWATEVKSDGRDADSLAEDIARTFYANASRPVEMNKMKIVHSWDSTKRLIEEYNEAPSCSDIELSHILLHSMEPCHQLMDGDYAEDVLNELVPVSSILTRVIGVFRNMMTFFRLSDGFQKPLNYTVYDEMSAFCEDDVDYSEKDENLDLWLKYFCFDILSMINSSAASDKNLTTEEKEYYIAKAINACESGLATLEKIVAAYPKEADYANLFFGYMHADLRNYCFSQIGQTEKAREHSKQAVESFKAFYLAYKQVYPTDTQLQMRYAQVFYLDAARHWDYIVDAEERIAIKRILLSFQAQHLKTSDKQHGVYLKLKAATDKILGVK